MPRKPQIPAAIRPFMKDDGPSPLQVLTGLMKMHLSGGNWELAGRYAIEAAPYRHAKAVAIAALPGQSDLFDVDPITRRPVLGFEWQQGMLAAPVVIDDEDAEQTRAIREKVARMTPAERQARIEQLHADCRSEQSGARAMNIDPPIDGTSDDEQELAELQRQQRHAKPAPEPEAPAGIPPPRPLASELRLVSGIANGPI